MKTTVRFIGFWVLFTLVANVNGFAMNTGCTDSSANCQFVENAEEYKACLVQRQIVDTNIWNALSSSDVELGSKLINETHNSTNIQRARRLMEQSMAIKTIWQKMSLREDLLSLEKSNTTFRNVHLVQTGCDYFITLRCILI